MPTKKVDVVIIGAGPGGYAAAFRAAQMKKKTLLVEKERLGGVCLNRGCIPSKALISAGHLYERMQKAATMGIEVKGAAVNMAQVQKWKSGVVERLTGGIAQLAKANGAEVMQGAAAFLTANALEVKTAGGTEKVEFQHCIIATGSKSIELKAFPVDGKRVLTSRHALDLTEVPEHLIVIGGGYIGLELGMAYMAFGAKLTVLEGTASLLPGMDPELLRVVERRLKKHGADIYVSAMAKSMKQDKNGVEVTFEAEGKTQSVKGTHLLVAVGRRPNTEGLALEKAGLAVTAKGFIEVNRHCQTTKPHIYAIGDVAAGGPMLAHRASYDAEVAAEHIAGHKDAAIDYKCVPWAVFTTPEIAGVGLSEEEAKKQGYELQIGKFPVAASGRLLTMGEDIDGMVKIIADKKTRRVLGVGMAGPEVSNLVSEAALAIEMGATLEDLSLTIHVHPTMPETIMEAAKHALGQAIHTLNK